MKIVVIGGTGLIGSKTVTILRQENPVVKRRRVDNAYPFRMGDMTRFSISIHCNPTVWPRQAKFIPHAVLPSLIAEFTPRNANQAS